MYKPIVSCVVVSAIVSNNIFDWAGFVHFARTEEGTAPFRGLRVAALRSNYLHSS